MTSNRQFLLAYLFLEIFWIAMTFALLREAYWVHFRYLSFYDGWNSVDGGLLFYLRLLAAIIIGGTTVGGTVSPDAIGRLADRW